MNRREPLLAFVRLRPGPDLRSHLESGDLLQVTLMRPFQHIDQFEGESRRSLVAWLASIAQNAIRDQADYVHRQRRDTDRTVKEETKRLEKAMESLDPSTGRSSYCASTRS